MKTKLCLCALLLSHSVPAALIDFNDIPIGTEVSSLNPYGNAVISTRLWVTQQGTTVAESFTRGVIGTIDSPLRGPAVTIQASQRDMTQPDARQAWHIQIGVAFQTPVSGFSVDAYSRFYNSARAGPVPRSA